MKPVLSYLLSGTFVAAFAALLWLVARRRRLARQAILDERRRLAEIVNLLPDATWAVDAGGTVIAWNQAIEELTGVKAWDMLGRGDYAYAVPFYGERRPILVDVAMVPDPGQEARYESFRRQGETVEAEAFIPHFGSGGVFIWARARRLRDSSGAVIGAIETVRDITERKRLQEVMVQTEKMVTVGGLAAGMAHEINNPLGVILQNIQNIQRRLSPGLPANNRLADDIGLDFDLLQVYLKQRGIFELLERVSTAGTRVAGVVEKMMSFGYRSSAILEPVRLEQLVDRVLDLVACDYDLIKRHELDVGRIVRRYDPGLPEVEVNRAEIEQAMINLVKNAIQSLYPLREGYEPRIVVSTRQSGSCAVFEVEDNGCGMSPEVSRRIFEPFFTTKEVGAGAGLGLAVVYAMVVKNHHGSVEVESAPGKGSKFTVNLPLPTRGPA